MRELVCTTALMFAAAGSVADELPRPEPNIPIGEAVNESSRPAPNEIPLPDNGPPEVAPRASARTNDSTLDADAADWRPRLLISLDISPGGAATLQRRQVTSFVPVYTEINGQQQLAYRSVTNTQTVQAPGQAALVCDDANISISAAETNKLKYNVECKGRSRIVLPGLIVTCDSFVLKEETAVCQNAVIRSGNVTATSESLQLQLDVSGVRTTQFDQPATSLTSPPATTLGAQPTPAKSPVPDWQPDRSGFRPTPDRQFEVDAAPRSFESSPPNQRSRFEQESVTPQYEDAPQRFEENPQPPAGSFRRT